MTALEGLVQEAQAVLDRGGVPADQRRAWFIPGRIEVLGKHVDYAGGRSLLCAIDRGIVLVARRRDDGQVVIRDARRNEAIGLPLHGGRGAARGPAWMVYPQVVVRRLQRNFGDVLPGCDLAMASNLPSAAGVSSSSALVVGLTLMLAGLSGLDQSPAWRAALPDRLALAGYLGALENGADFGALAGEAGVGTLGGAQDHTAILCCAADRLDVFGWAPVRHERAVAWPAEQAFVVAVSGVTAAKAGAARERYNRAARTAAHLVAAWNAATGDAVRTLAGAFDAAVAPGRPGDGVPAALEAAAVASATDEFPAGHLVRRLQQFHDETWRWVPQAADALARRDLAAFGAVVDASQAGAEAALENQVPETVALVRLARESGAAAASAFGAGFGGSVWAMVDAAHAEAFAARWRRSYLGRYPRLAARAQCFVTRPSPAACEVVLV